MDQSIKLAKLWAALDGIKEQLDNVALPLGGFLGLHNPPLMIAMEELSAEIASHFEKFQLVVQHRITE